jgi:RNA polymerase sigma factor (sigma-70 family)
MDTNDLSTEEGQNALIIEIHRLAHRIAKRSIRPRHAADDIAEDVAQDVVLYCLIRLRENRWDIGDRALDSHIGCLVRRRARTLRHRRIASMERDMEYLRDLEGSVRTWMEPEAKMDAEELHALCAATLAGQSRMGRAAFDLVRNRGWSYARAAEELGISRKGVQAHIVRAQAALRKALRGREMVVPA